MKTNTVIKNTAYRTNIGNILILYAVKYGLHLSCPKLASKLERKILKLIRYKVLLRKMYGLS